MIIMQTNNSNKSLLIAMGTGANNMVIGYLCERLADQVDFVLIDSLDQKEWDKVMQNEWDGLPKEKQVSGFVV